MPVIYLQEAATHCGTAAIAVRLQGTPEARQTLLVPAIYLQEAAAHYDLPKPIMQIWKPDLYAIQGSPFKCK